MTTQPHRHRTAYRIVMVGFTLIFAAMIWPIYPLFSRIHPMVLGMPFSLFYLIVLITASFLLLLGLYIWERHEGETP